MIKILTISDFQQHKNLTINFTSGVNVIWGDTGTGKSSIRRAITNTLLQSPSGDFRRRTGNKKVKQCKVEITTDNYVLQRIRTQTLNRYILNNDEDAPFDASGKQVPQKIQDIVQLKPLIVKDAKYLLNVQDQLSPHFLLIGDGLGTIRANILSQITGDDILDKAVTDLNKDLLSLTKEEKQLEVSVIDIKSQIDNLNGEINTLSGIYNPILNRFKALNEKKGYLDTLSGLSLKFDRFLLDFEASQKVIVVPNTTNCKELYNKYTIINELSNKLSQNQTKLRDVEESKKSLKIVDCDLDILQETCYTLSEIQELETNWLYNQQITKETDYKLNKLQVELNMLQNKKEELSKQIKFCPITNKPCSQI